MRTLEAALVCALVMVGTGCVLDREVALYDLALDSPPDTRMALVHDAGLPPSEPAAPPAAPAEAVGSGPDASVEPQQSNDQVADPAAQAPADPGVDQVVCGATECSLPGTTCCWSASLLWPFTYTGSCEVSCPLGAGPSTCDGPEDCPSGQLCCASGTGGSACQASCGASDTLCKDDSQCGARRCVSRTDEGLQAQRICQ